MSGVRGGRWPSQRRGDEELRALSSRTLASQRERQRQSELRRREAEREERSEGGSGGGYSGAQQMGRKGAGGEACMQTGSLRSLLQRQSRTWV